MNSTTILIAGATGFIGKELVLFLLQNGFVVNILTRNREKAKKKFDGRVGIYNWKGQDAQGEFIKPFDVVINLAGASIGAKKWTKAYKKILLESRTQSISAINKIIASIKCTPKMWLQASAIGYYGYNMDVKVDESGQKGEGFLANLVDQWEQEFNNVVLPETHKVKLRLGVVLSYKGGFLAQIQETIKFGFLVCPGNGNNYLSFVYLDELVKSIHTIILFGSKSGIINMVTDKPLRILDFIAAIAKENKIKFVLKIPAFIFTLMFGKEKAMELIMANQKVISKQHS